LQVLSFPGRFAENWDDCGYTDLYPVQWSVLLPGWELKLILDLTNWEEEGDASAVSRLGVDLHSAPEQSATLSNIA